MKTFKEFLNEDGFTIHDFKKGKYVKYGDD